MAIASGVSVANIYCNQPILKDIASSFQVSEGEVGSISVLSQVGYGLGLFFLIPLGDQINKKKLILCLRNRSGGRGAIVKNSHQNLINWVSWKNSPQIICNRYPQKIGRKLQRASKSW